MRYLLCPLVWLLINGPIHAQVNIEEYRQQDADSGISGNFGAGIEAQTGNTDIQELTVEGRLDFVKPAVTSFIVVNSEFGWEQGQSFSNEGLLHIRRMYRITEKVHVESFAQYNFDKTIFIDHRALFGGGVRFRLIRGNQFHLWQGTGYMFEHERLTVATTGHPRRMSVSRWTNYLSTRFTAGDRVASAWTVYMQPRFRAMGDFRLLSDINLEVNLGGPLYMTLSFQMRYDSRPPDGINRIDTKFDQAITIVF